MVSNTIAVKLIQYIADNSLAAGTRLPSIREFATLWNCNQSQVRTGLITLATLGIIDMHPRAGSFVKSIASSDLENLFILIFQLGMIGNEIEALNLYAVKSILDREIFINAAKYRTESDILRLEENLARQAQSFDNIQLFVETDEEFHLLLGKIIRNPVIFLLLEAIQIMIRPYRYKNLNPDICRESYKGHIEIFEAVKNQDEAAADNIASTHTLPGIMRLRANKEQGSDQAHVKLI